MGLPKPFLQILSRNRKNGSQNKNLGIIFPSYPLRVKNRPILGIEQRVNFISGIFSKLLEKFGSNSGKFSPES